MWGFLTFLPRPFWNMAIAMFSLFAVYLLGLGLLTVVLPSAFGMVGAYAIDLIDIKEIVPAQLFSFEITSLFNLGSALTTLAATLALQKYFGGAGRLPESFPSDDEFTGTEYVKQLQIIAPKALEFRSRQAYTNFILDKNWNWTGSFIGNGFALSNVMDTEKPSRAFREILQANYAMAVTIEKLREIIKQVGAAEETRPVDTTIRVDVNDLPGLQEWINKHPSDGLKECAHDWFLSLGVGNAPPPPAADPSGKVDHALADRFFRLFGLALDGTATLGRILKAVMDKVEEMLSAKAAVIAQKDDEIHDLTSKLASGNIGCGAWCTPGSGIGNGAAPAGKLGLTPKDIPAFSGTAGKVEDWVFKVTNVFTPWLSVIDGLGEFGLKAMVALIKGSFTGSAISWAKTWTPDFKEYGEDVAGNSVISTRSAEDLLIDICDHLRMAFRDAEFVKNKRAALDSYSGFGKTWKEFYLGFESLCVDAEVKTFGQNASSAVATYFRKALPNKCYKDLQSAVNKDPEGMTYESMCHELENRWTKLTARTSTFGRGATTTTISVAASAGKTNQVQFSNLPECPKSKLVGRQGQVARFDENLNGYIVPAANQGRLTENPGLKERLLQENLCILCRRPGAPHRFPHKLADGGNGPNPRFVPPPVDQ